MLELNDRVAIITGSSSGIGRETAKLFSRRGAAVVVVARRAHLLQELAEELRAEGGKVLVIPGDVTVPDFAEDVCRQAAETFGRVDILVNNAGIGDRSTATVRTDNRLWDEVTAVDETAVFRFCRAALRYMTVQGSGSIINISSIGGVYSIAGAAYSSAKAAVLGLTKNIAIQYVGTGIRCNAVCPGPTNTAMIDPSVEMDTEMMAAVDKRIDNTAGMCDPIDIANAILFFAADESRYVNGQALVVDKGSCI